MRLIDSQTISSSTIDPTLAAEPIRLTQFSHGAGCGCKIAPAPLDIILQGLKPQIVSPRILIGTGARDDAAVYALDDSQAMVCTVDFFMPIVDDAADFGAIAAVNALSDIYAMGANPVLALAVLGWPIKKLPLPVAAQVLRGASEACQRAGCSIVGGHSIDAPEPIFGLCVTGLAPISKIRTNAGARVGCELYLTKPLGIGILTTAQKRGKLREADLAGALQLMLTLNDIGPHLAELDSVATMTDVTGFGLLGHLIEVCLASGVTATIRPHQVPRLDNLDEYIADGLIPGGTANNFESYGNCVEELDAHERAILCDPQTSGGLLVAVHPSGKDQFLALVGAYGLQLAPFGSLSAPDENGKLVRFARR